MISAPPVQTIPSLIYGDQRQSGRSTPENRAADSALRAAVTDRISLSPAPEEPSKPASADTKAAAEETGTRPVSSEEALYKRQVLSNLQTRDREVRAHEQAHLAVAGSYARSGASFVYQHGPDGKRYAVGGEVSIDISKEQTPEETIRKMQTVRRAALAPLNPSATDRQVAARATVLMAQAQRELQMEHMVDRSAEAVTDARTASPEGGETASNAIERNRSQRYIRTYQSLMTHTER